MDENPYQSPRAQDGRTQRPASEVPRPRFFRIRTVFEGFAVGVVAGLLVSIEFLGRVVLGVFVASCYWVVFGALTWLRRP